MTTSHDGPIEVDCWQQPWQQTIPAPRFPCIFHGPRSGWYIAVVVGKNAPTWAEYPHDSAILLKLFIHMHLAIFPLVGVTSHPKNISRVDCHPQVWLKIQHIWNHQPLLLYGSRWQWWHSLELLSPVCGLIPRSSSSQQNIPWKKSGKLKQRRRILIYPIAHWYPYYHWFIHWYPYRCMPLVHWTRFDPTKIRRNYHT